MLPHWLQHYAKKGFRRENMLLMVHSHLGGAQTDVWIIHRIMPDC